MLCSALYYRGDDPDDQDKPLPGISFTREQGSPAKLFPGGLANPGRIFLSWDIGIKKERDSFPKEESLSGSGDYLLSHCYAVPSA